MPSAVSVAAFVRLAAVAPTSLTWPRTSNAAAPWEVHRPQQAVRELLTAGSFKGSVLDCGCGIGASVAARFAHAGTHDSPWPGAHGRSRLLRQPQTEFHFLHCAYMLTNVQHACSSLHQSAFPYYLYRGTPCTRPGPSSPERPPFRRSQSNHAASQRSKPTNLMPSRHSRGHAHLPAGDNSLFIAKYTNCTVDAVDLVSSLHHLLPLASPHNAHTERSRAQPIRAAPKLRLREITCLDTRR